MNEWTQDPAFRFRKKELRGPDPVGAKGMRVLDFLAAGNPFWVAQASTTVERLRRSGYVAVDETGIVEITDAGRALLGQQLRSDAK